MGSSRPSEDRSLGGGISFPQWMRGKVDNRFDFDQSSFSPPSADDGFFYIRYPTSSGTAQTQQKQSGFHSISKVLNDQQSSGASAENLKSLATETKSTSTTTTTTTTNPVKENKSVDFSKLPLPCQPFVPVANKSYPYEAKGTDDGFHSEPARCGKSIVTVANRIMQSATVGKKVENDKPSATEMEMNDKQSKVSKSLPVTPITTPISTPEGSPKSRRRANGNRYFTSAFVPDRDKYQGGWLLSSILSQSREILGNKIDEDDENKEIVVPHRALNRKKSISSQNLMYFGKDDVSTDKPTPAATPTGSTTITFQATPSELREMNFWSPTSM